MIETTGTFLEYEVAYRAERLRGLTTPRRAERAAPASSRFRRRSQRGSKVR
jgi:hypothetical protein